TAPAEMTAIDCSDCYLTIEIGDGVKRALIRHFAGFIAAQLATRDVVAKSDTAHDKIDRASWRVAARALEEGGAEIEGALDETLLAPDPQKTVQEILSATVETVAADVAEHYL